MAGARVCLGVNAANQYALDEVVFCITGTPLFEARCAHYRLRLLFGILMMDSTSPVRRALRMQRSLLLSADEAVKKHIWWYHTVLFLSLLAPHAAHEGVPSLEGLVATCMRGSAADNIRALSHMDREWVQKVCRRFSQELMERRMAAHRSLDGTRDLLLQRTPVFMRQLHGRRDCYRILALCGPRAWIPHSAYFAGAAAFVSLTAEQSRLANPRRACPFCQTPGAFTTPHVIAACSSEAMRQARCDVLLPAYSRLSVYQQRGIPDPAVLDDTGVWLALAVGVSHPFVHWSSARRWDPWQVVLYDCAGVFVGRVIREAREAFVVMERDLAAPDDCLWACE